jgi:hypothetical protein
VELATELEASLREFVTASSVEVRENGGRVAPFTGLSWEVRGTAEKPLLHLWSASYNLTRRVLAITDHSEERLALAVERFGRRKPDRLEFVRVEFEPSPRELSREEFCERLGRILAQQFPDETLESLTVAPDLEHSLSRNYARGLLRRGSSLWAVLAVPDGESAETTENSLTFALLWLERARHSAHRGSIAGVRLILPKGASRGVSYRARALRSQFSLEIYERDPMRETLTKMDPQLAGNLDTWLVPRREPQSLLDQASGDLDPIIALAPRAITAHPQAQSREVWLRFRGLAFARWHGGRVFFGATDVREKLSSPSDLAFKQLLHDLELYRHPLATDTRHSLFRQQPERWLESIVREDVSRIDASFDSRFAYTKVFADAGGDHGILDLLTVTRSGRLAIIELKASEYMHLPLQAADYWLRIRRHLELGDFARCGFFPGVELQSAPPLVVLVAPALRFHPANDILLRQLSSELEISRIGLAESWRRGIRVVMRH